MRYFFVESTALQVPVVAIKGSEARHIINVLRLKPGDKIRVFDGEGFEYEAFIYRFLADGVEIKITNKFPGTKESSVQIAVAQALLKEKKMDRLLRHLCELGITQWVPYISERSVPRPKIQRVSSRKMRWEKIVKESCKQCQRAKLPEIHEMMTFSQVLEYGHHFDFKIVFYENESVPLHAGMLPLTQPAPQKFLLVLGPEGGFSDAEIAAAKKQGYVLAGLGPRILRAETATIAACTVVQSLFGDMGQKNLDKEGSI